MQYALLIYDDEQVWASMSDDERGALHQEYGAFTQELIEAGALQGGEQLQGTEAATSVRRRNGETLTTDGPFTETKEHLAGFYVIEAPSLDDALAWAAKVPSARVGTIEVRPTVPAPVEASA